MRRKKVESGFRSIEASLDDFVNSGEAIMRGELVEERRGIFFTSYEAYRKAKHSNPDKVQVRQGDAETDQNRQESFE